MSPVQIALGTVTFGREIDEPAARALMDYAVERGIRRFDTAAAYGQGASESVIGRWRRDRGSAADAIQVNTKLLPPYTPESIARAVALSRERLGLERLPLLYLHRWDEALRSPATLRALDQLVRTGQVARLGASNFTVELLAETLAAQAALRLTPFQAIQNNHNFAVREITPALQALCAAHQLEIVTYSPLGAGFLTGKHSAGVAAGSRFELVPGHQPIYFQPEAQERLAALQRHAARTGASAVTLALRWALNQPVDCVLVGGRERRHLDQALTAAEQPASILTGLD